MKRLSISMTLITVLGLAACAGGDAGEGTVAGDCTDGADNDGDGNFDCNDSGCSGAPVCRSGNNQNQNNNNQNQNNNNQNQNQNNNNQNQNNNNQNQNNNNQNTLAMNGSACSLGSECQSNRCYVPPSASTGYCTDTCTNGANCLYLQSAICGRPNGSAQDICVVPDHGQRCVGNSDCMFGSCLYRDSGDQSGYCTSECESFSDCPSFWECREIGSGAGKRCIQD